MADGERATMRERLAKHLQRGERLDL